MGSSSIVPADDAYYIMNYLALWVVRILGGTWEKITFLLILRRFLAMPFIHYQNSKENQYEFK